MKAYLKKYLSIFNLPVERQRKVIEQIKSESRGDLDFYTLSFFSVIIISLGLILNNSAVIIGGMLITPLVWPMLAMALGMVRGSVRLFEISLLTIIKVILLTLLTSYLIGLLSPFKELGVEILSRTQPTILELVIALAAGFVAAFVISYPRLGSFIAGVVIAAAVVPPLCVVGISFALNSLAQAGGAFLLFVANLIAVILAATGFFYLARFEPVQTELGKERRKGHIFWSIIFLIVVLIPLVIITKDIISQNRQYQLAKEVIVTDLLEGSLVELAINQKEGALFIEATLRARSNLSSRQMDKLINLLTQKLNRSINLQITVIPTLQGGKTIEPVAQPNYIQTNLNEDLEGLRKEVFPQVGE